MIIVTEVEQTCLASPSQWEGVDQEEHFIYARYRWGYLSVERNDQEIVGKQLGERFHGCMSYAELKSVTSGLIVWPETYTEIDAAR